MKAAVRAEVLKVLTVRALWLGGALAALAVPMFSLLVVGTGGLGVDDTITSGAATGTVIGLLAFGTWAGAAAAGEYAHTMSVSLASVPKRARLFVAKVVTAAGGAGVAATASAVVALGVVAAIIPPGEHDLGNPAALLSLVLAVMAVAVLATSVGVLTRSTTASLLIVAVAVLLPKAAGGLLGGLEPWVVGASPGTVVTQVVGGAQLAPDQTYPLGDLGAVLTMVAVATLVAVGGAMVFQRRDGG